VIPPVAKADLLRQIRAARSEWDALVASIPRGRLTEPGLPGGWSVKDVLAHIAWGQRENVGVVRARALVGSELWRLGEDERNAVVYAQNRDRLLDDVLAESERIHAEYLAALASLSEDELNDPAGLPSMPPGWRPWRILYDPGHYAHHAADVRAWLMGSSTPA
jgi:uncharacterized protein (TIGR03083 family)